MQAVKDDIETIHLYVVREKEKKPYTVLPLLGAFLCLLGIVAVTFYSADHPAYEHERLILPAHFLPLQTFVTTQAIIPTGIHTYPATTAHGLLTITNGSVISQTIPQGFTIDGVTTDYAVFVPAGSADGYGHATVSAHATQAGEQGNISALAINVVEGSSVFIRNLSPFTGGRDSYSVKIITQQDRQTALDSARTSLTAQVSRRQAMLAQPCSEQSGGVVKLVVKWMCQYVAYPQVSIPNARITSFTLKGKNLLVDVVFVSKPRRIWVK